MDRFGFTFRAALRASQWFGIEGLPKPTEEEREEIRSDMASRGERELEDEGSPPEPVVTEEVPKSKEEESEDDVEVASEGEKDDQKRLDNLVHRAQGCELCKLCEKRNRVVVGSGPLESRLMVVGEAPGAQEDKQGVPFVGRAGQLLTRMLKAIDLERDEVYITNIVKCRPPGNRDPQRDEINSCWPYLLEQIEIIAPEIILTVGGYATRTLLDKPPQTSLRSLRGQKWYFRGTPLVATYHPAALLRRKSLKKYAWEDLKYLRDLLGDS